MIKNCKFMNICGENGAIYILDLMVLLHFSFFYVERA